MNLTRRMNLKSGMSILIVMKYMRGEMLVHVFIWVVDVIKTTKIVWLVVIVRVIQMVRVLDVGLERTQGIRFISKKYVCIMHRLHMLYKHKNAKHTICEFSKQTCRTKYKKTVRVVWMKERKKTFDACHCSYHNEIGPRNEIVSIGGYKNAFKKDNSNCLGILI